MSSDPIGLLGGLNTFGYVGQNPLSYFDNDGLSKRSGGNPYSRGRLGNPYGIPNLGTQYIRPQLPPIWLMQNYARQHRQSQYECTSRIVFPPNSSQIQHIFRDAPGHLRDTPTNRSLLEGVANNPRNNLGRDRFGNNWSGMTRPDGSQVWVQTRNGIIQNGGVNTTPRTFNPQTGLSGR